MIKYLAIPYTHNNPEVRNLRFEIANLVSSMMMKKGEIIFSPISHTAPMEKYGLPVEWSFWKDQDTHFLNVCDEIYVTMIDGWKVSTGVTAEINHMVEKGTKVTFINPETLDCEELNRMVEQHNKLL